ncbi:MAG: hypothetical protein ISS28_01695 [Candidatus Cloacimonetes bacterium]|nr:hypothetical protein [Candidatus Cloacimonadota bacterium]
MVYISRANPGLIIIEHSLKFLKNAINILKKTQLKYLGIGNFLVEK